jgi:flagellar biosynthesis protein FlhA
MTAAATVAQPKNASQRNDLFITVALALIIGMMIAPLPSLLLDMALILNIGISVLIVLIAMYITEPLQFSVFPSLLLIITLFRLGLNVSASRMILAQATAGRVIETFGGFVVGGNYVVGVVVFVTLLVIQFLVITNGAGRVAEVAARFTLDAMPGKQLSIDADLNSGLIDEAEARRRRRMVEQEADFYGAMDGASKFVKGDAIAAVVIVVVNIIGGFVIGLWQHGMDIIEALETYTLLTVGQGLVTQIPSLLVSTATGLIVTRSASEESLGSDVTHQLSDGNAMMLVAGFLILLGLVPGMPKVPFLGLGVALGVVAAVIRSHRQAVAGALGEDAEGAPAAGAAQLEAGDTPKALLQVDPLEIELGFALIPLVDETQEDNLLNRVTSIRRQLAMELGFVLPKVRIRDNLRLPTNRYRIKLRGAEVGQGELLLGQMLAMPTQPGVPEPEDGHRTAEPAFGLPAWWVDTSTQAQLELMGYTVVDPLSVLVTHLSETIRAHAPQLLSLQDVQDLLDNLRQAAPAAVDGVVPERLTLSELQEVLRNLLRERVSIRDLGTILETVSRYADTRDTALLTELARRALSYAISDQHAEEGIIHVVTLDPATEAELVDRLDHGQGGAPNALALDPASAQELLQEIGRAVEQLAQVGHQPILLCSADVRRPLARLTERSLPNLTVLSYNEIAPTVQVEAHAMVTLRMAA